MGVRGLWRLLEPAASGVRLDRLAEEVLAVDISIWLHQAIKGFRGSKEASVANAHLLALFRRLCKLLYYGIKPVFVFDGSFPILKRQTIQNRQNQKAKMRSDVDKIRKKLLEVAVRSAAIRTVTTHEASPTKKTSTNSKNDDDDLFKLPVLENINAESSSESEEEKKDEKNNPAFLKFSHINLHSIDVNAEDFRKLSARDRHDILSELKETRKQSSWGRIDELPSNSNQFSDYQMNRLLKRRQVQVTLEETEKEIGGRNLTLNELEILLNEEGIDTKIDAITTRQIASNENAKFVLVKNIKEALDKATELEESKQLEKNKDEVKESTSKDSVTIVSQEVDKDDDENLKLAIKLSMQNYQNTEDNISEVDIVPDDLGPIEIESEDDSDLNLAIELSLKNHSDYVQLKDTASTSNSDVSKGKSSSFNLAKAYMLEYSGLSDHEVNRILNNKSQTLSKPQQKINLTDAVIEKIKTDVKIKGAYDLTASESDSDCFEDVLEKPSTSKINLRFSESDSLEEITDKSSIVCDSDKKQKESELKSSESDSDSFEEVPENSPNVEQSIQIKPDDDIFADVFKDCDDLKLEQLKKTIAENLKKKIDCIDNLDDIPTEPRKEEEDKPKIIIDDTTEKMFEKTKTVLNDRINNVQNVKLNVSKDESEEAKIKNPPLPKPTLTKEMMLSMADDLEEERDTLVSEQNKLDRMGSNVTDQMTQEAQELLKLFGVPFIVAPMEAEAQCAFLESIKLTNGTITDDSDIWLFGGKTVYRNFFDHEKHVLKFISENIESSFKLKREDLILLAMLVGSDYTNGISGVGPVTALEILAAFPSNKNEIKPPYAELLSGLKKFKAWLHTKNALYHANLRKKLKNISLTEEFPDHMIIEAYLCPEVETSKETFSWGKPDLPSLVDYAKRKFSWTREKTEEILKPVINKMNSKVSQLSINSFFNTEFKSDVANLKMSKRVKKAIDIIEKDKSFEEDKADVQDVCMSNDSELKGTKRKLKEKACNTKTGKNKKQKSEIVDQTLDIRIVPADKIEEKLKKQMEIMDKMRKSDIIPQREADKNILLKNKLKAIELFRKSKKGPGFIKHQKRKAREPKADAELSESSSD